MKDATQGEIKRKEVTVDHGLCQSVVCRWKWQSNLSDAEVGLQRHHICVTLLVMHRVVMGLCAADSLSYAWRTSVEQERFKLRRGARACVCTKVVAPTVEQLPYFGTGEAESDWT